MSKKTIKVQNGIETLFINDQPSVCPFRGSQLVQDQFGRNAFINQTCQSNCPHFVLYTDSLNPDGYGPANLLELTCGRSKAQIPVIIEKEGNNDLGNISIHR